MNSAPPDSFQVSLDQAVPAALDRTNGRLWDEGPNWEPLVCALPAAWRAGFMWVGTAYQAEQAIECYKHGITRNSLNLDAGLRAYRYIGEGLYEEIPLANAMSHAFAGLAEMGLQPSVAYDDTFILKRNRRLRQLGYTIRS